MYRRSRSAVVARVERTRLTTSRFAASFGEPEGFLHPAAYAGTVAPGASGALGLTLDATGYTDGTYTADLVLTTNDPDQAQIIVPVTMRVGTKKTIYVDADASGANNGSSWTDAYTSLQSALQVATGNDEIWVAEGTYRPGGTSPRGTPFLITAAQDGLKLYGGFAGTETAFCQRDPAAAVGTILAGDFGVSVTLADNAFTIFNMDVPNGDSITATTVLDGLSSSTRSQQSLDNDAVAVGCSSTPAIGDTMRARQSGT